MILRLMSKDRMRELLLAPDVLIVVRRSSAHSVEYAILLLTERDGEWHTVRTFDNAHAREEHHTFPATKSGPLMSSGAISRRVARLCSSATRRSCC